MLKWQHYNIMCVWLVTYVKLYTETSNNKGVGSVSQTELIQIF